MSYDDYAIDREFESVRREMRGLGSTVRTLLTVMILAGVMHLVECGSRKAPASAVTCYELGYR